MLPPKPFSEMTDEEILDEIRALRVRRVAATERAQRPRGAKKKSSDAAMHAAIKAILESDGDGTDA